MKKFSIILIILMFAGFLYFYFLQKSSVKVLVVYSPNKIAADFNKNGSVEDNEIIFIKDFETFQSKTSVEQKNKAKMIGVSEEDALVTGFLAENFAKNFFENKTCKINIEKQIVQKIVCENIDYILTFKASPYAIKDGKPLNAELFNTMLKKARKAQYRIFNNKSSKVHRLNCKYGQLSSDFIILPSVHIPKNGTNCKYCLGKKVNLEPLKVIKKFKISNGDIKLYLTDLTSVLKPDSSCNTEYCQAILNEINKAQSTIDMALYGYADVPEITKAFKNAQERGVKLRLVYDIDSKSSNFYPDTFKLVDLIKENASDTGEYSYQNALMHNKFFIIDGKTVITGSANLSTTDMSGYNSNTIVIINSKEIAEIYELEFAQMYAKKFHKIKSKFDRNQNIKIGNSVVSVYFSPKDNVIINEIIPLVNDAKKYIYIPTFLITHKKLAQSIVDAKMRGVEVKVILDATNALSKHSTHELLRKNGILVKTENYAGKMHSKSMIIDGKYIVIGSMNFSFSGETKNDENILVIKDAQFAKFYSEFFEYVWKKIPDIYLSKNVRSESKESRGSCMDGIDNNFDGKIDLQDVGCKSIAKQKRLSPLLFKIIE